MAIGKLQHIALIMDGNGRWAQQKGLSRTEGHFHGAQRIETLVDNCKERGIKFVTLYAFSDENWQRPESEVVSLMALLCAYLKNKREKMAGKGVCFRVIGDIERLSDELKKEINLTESATKKSYTITLTVALSYGGRQEICRAVNRLIENGTTCISPDDINQNLDAPDVPAPDLLIRTSGECRISNFLLWQSAYSELYFTDILWPDFDANALDQAITEYTLRERRFGLISEQIK